MSAGDCSALDTGASGGGEKRAGVGGVRAAGKAVEIDLQQVRVARLRGKPPELRLGRSSSPALPAR